MAFSSALKQDNGPTTIANCLSMLGYAANINVGAITYNAVHTYVGPLVLVIRSRRIPCDALSLIWIAHRS
jgi:hypothetical protein